MSDEECEALLDVLAWDSWVLAEDDEWMWDHPILLSSPVPLWHARKDMARRT